LEGRRSHHRHAHQSHLRQRRPTTEERIIKSIKEPEVAAEQIGQPPTKSRTKITIDKPLAYDHLGTGDFRAEVANLSRNVTIESADPKGIRGHTMYHVGSAGSISYAEFRHLGKAGTLGRYSLHFHLCGDTMRGSSVVGASMWDSHNRWLTIHGTNYLVVRDCVGYKSLGHGFFLEDAPKSSTSSTAISPSAPFAPSDCRNRCCHSTPTTALASGGPTA